jgi:hypothetical protein
MIADFSEEAVARLNPASANPTVNEHPPPNG